MKKKIANHLGGVPKINVLFTGTCRLGRPRKRWNEIHMMTRVPYLYGVVRVCRIVHVRRRLPNVRLGFFFSPRDISKRRRRTARRRSSTTVPYIDSLRNVYRNDYCRLSSSTVQGQTTDGLCPQSTAEIRMNFFPTV